MKKYKILALAIFACVTLNGWAQSEDNVTGRVLDEKGKPVAGALVSVEENPLVRVATDKNGRFEITAVKGSRLKVQTGDDAMKVVKIEITDLDCSKRMRSLLVPYLLYMQRI